MSGERRGYTTFQKGKRKKSVLSTKGKPGPRGGEKGRKKNYEGGTKYKST